MKINLSLLIVAMGATFLTGCESYDYQIIHPVSPQARIMDQPVTIVYEPLEYRVSRYKDSLGMTVINPTTNQIVLRGDRSYVVDPRGESHPIRGRIIGPHSYAPMLLPPTPKTGETFYPGYYGPGWWPGYPYPYAWGGFYGSYYGPVPAYYNVYSQYDWKWDVGEARIHLTYEESGKYFDHEFVILRERQQ